MDSILGISGLISLVNSTIQANTQSAYQSLSSFLQPTLSLMLVLYVAFFGVAHLNGQVPFDLWRTARHLIVMVVITAFVTRWDFFALYFGNLFTDGPAQLMTAVSAGSGDPNAMLSDVWDRGIIVSNALLQMGGLSTLGFWVAGVTVFYMTLVCVAYALYLIVLSKLALAILLGLAPLFFSLYLFEATREYFHHYIRQVVNFALIPVFTAAILGLMLKIPQQMLIQLQQALASHSGHGGRQCFLVLLAFYLLLHLLHQVTGLSSGIATGLQLNPGHTALIIRDKIGRHLEDRAYLTRTRAPQMAKKGLYAAGWLTGKYRRHVLGQTPPPRSSPEKPS